MRAPASSISLAALALLLAACGEQPIPRARAIDHAADAEAREDDDSAADDDSDDETLGEDDETTDDAAADDTTDDDGGDLSALFESCHIDPDQPSKELVNFAFTGVPIQRKGTTTVVIPINYTATIDTTLKIVGSMLANVTDTNVKVKVEPSIGQKKGDEEAKKKTGKQTTDIMPLDQRQDLGTTAPQWDGIACAVPAATRITTVTGVGTTSATFAPALPSSVSPLPDVERYDIELDQPRTFTGIVATVTQSADTTVPVGSKHTGTVTVKRIDPTYVGKQIDGSPITVGGDLAFEVTASFGTPAVTAALGVKPSTKFYIDTTAHKYKAIVVESGEADTPPLVFIRQ